MKTYYVYILASKKNGTLYIGITSNLAKRVGQHKESKIKGFTKKHHVHMLVYYEAFDDVYRAIQRKKELKRWNRQWKIRLIEEENPLLKDLFFELG